MVQIILDPALSLLKVINMVFGVVVEVVAVEEKAVAALPAAALQEIEEAPKAHAHVAETNEDKLFVKAASSGDFTYLEEKWEEFADKSTRPGEDDDDEDDEDDGESLIL